MLPDKTSSLIVCHFWSRNNVSSFSTYLTVDVFVLLASNCIRTNLSQQLSSTELLRNKWSWAIRIPKMRASSITSNVWSYVRLDTLVRPKAVTSVLMEVMKPWISVEWISSPIRSTTFSSAQTQLIHVQGERVFDLFFRKNFLYKERGEECKKVVKSKRD